MGLRHIWMAVAVMVAGVAALLIQRSRDEHELRSEAHQEPEPAGREAPSAASTDAPEAVGRRLEQLTAEVAELREEVARLRSGAKDDDKAPMPEAELSPEEAKALWDDRMSLVEAGFNDEPTDSRWAGEVRTKIEAALAAYPPLRAAARSTECRSRTCRVELSTDAQGSLSDDISALTSALGEQLPTVMYDSIDEPGGRQTQVLYFTRDQADPSASSAQMDTH